MLKRTALMNLFSFCADGVQYNEDLDFLLTTFILWCWICIYGLVGNGARCAEESTCLLLLMPSSWREIIHIEENPLIYLAIFLQNCLCLRLLVKTGKLPTLAYQWYKVRVPETCFRTHREVW